MASTNAIYIDISRSSGRVTCTRRGTCTGELPVFVEGLELSVEQEVEDVELSLKKELKS